MFKTRFLPAVAAVMTFILFSTAAGAAEPTDGKRDFGTLSCKDIMRLSGEDRDIALAFAHGYRLGKMNTTKYEIDKLAAITDQFIEHCLDNPNDKALATFEKLGR